MYIMCIYMSYSLNHVWSVNLETSLTIVGYARCFKLSMFLCSDVITYLVFVSNAEN